MTIPTIATTFGYQLLTVGGQGEVLNANTTYWVALEPGGSFGARGNSTASGLWGPMRAVVPASRGTCRRRDSSFALEVQGYALSSSTPEPNTGLVLGVGLLGLAVYHRRWQPKS